MTVRVSGIDEAVKAFDDYDAATQRRGKQAIQQGARRVERAAKRLAPVDTGVLRSGINVVSPTALSAEINAYAEYAPYVEYGTATQSAQPFLGPAYLQEVPSILRDLREALNP